MAARRSGSPPLRIVLSRGLSCECIWLLQTKVLTVSESQILRQELRKPSYCVPAGKVGRPRTSLERGRSVQPVALHTHGCQCVHYSRGDHGIPGQRPHDKEIIPSPLIPIHQFGRILEPAVLLIPRSEEHTSELQSH